ncbi:MAG: transglutaminase-like cysteine peptidase [Alphaproteobacteria bacterium]|nr:transglutaminase-like cysteine peptidase [Alphaproteobacteria bacterium]
MKTRKLAIAFALAAGMVTSACGLDKAPSAPPPGPLANASFTQVAANDTSPNLTLGSGTWALPGHRDFCRRIPTECESNGQQGHFVIMNKQIGTMLDRVNRAHNNAITYQYDKDQYGREEYWTYPDSGKGDCEDYALAKRRDLIARGWPPSALLIASVTTETGEGHAVLVARTNQGDFVLDNRYSAVMPWQNLPYEWHRIQSPRHSGHWVNIRNNTGGSVLVSAPGPR